MHELGGRIFVNDVHVKKRLQERGGVVYEQCKIDKARTSPSWAASSRHSRHYLLVAS